MCLHLPVGNDAALLLGVVAEGRATAPLGVDALAGAHVRAVDIGDELVLALDLVAHLHAEEGGVVDAVGLVLAVAAVGLAVADKLVEDALVGLAAETLRLVDAAVSRRRSVLGTEKSALFCNNDVIDTWKTPVKKSLINRLGFLKAVRNTLQCRIADPSK